MIKTMIIHDIESGQYADDGEKYIECDIDFILRKPIHITGLDKECILDRLNLSDSWNGLSLAFMDSDRITYENFPIPYKLRLEILAILESEQEEEGHFQGMCLTDDLIDDMYDLLDKNDTSYCFGCTEQMNDNCTCMKSFYCDDDCEE